MKKVFMLLSSTLMVFHMAMAQSSADMVTVATGKMEGVTNTATGIRSFKGIPFAAPPVGDLRWKEPQPAKNWDGVFKADHFGHNAMQKKVFGDMGFRSDNMSEDCLYLNVWMPLKKPSTAKLPVLVYFFGGGFVAGDGSESRYDGESMAQKGIVAVTINYRLGVFGFFSHPELTQESPHHASGNYGLLDQHAALLWVKANIAKFGGDPDHITIAGESAGSIAVSAQMASPLSKDLIAGAIGESGAMINPTLPAIPLADGEKAGVRYAEKIGAKSIADLRAIPADKLLDEAPAMGDASLSATVDGFFLTKPLVATFEAGEQAKVPLLAGWNSAEVPYQFIMRATIPTVATYTAKLKELYGDKADEVLKLYPAKDDEEAVKSATLLASDRFIVYSTWKWDELQAKTSGKPVYRYIFSRSRPAMVGDGVAGLAGGVIKGGPKPAAVKMPVYIGAAHASEIEYAMGNLAGNKFYGWTPDDYKVSATMEDYFANFIKTGNPNGAGLAKWVPNTAGSTPYTMDIDVNSHSMKSTVEARYWFLDKEYNK